MMIQIYSVLLCQVLSCQHCKCLFFQAFAHHPPVQNVQIPEPVWGSVAKQPEGRSRLSNDITQLQMRRWKCPSPWGQLLCVRAASLLLLPYAPAALCCVVMKSNAMLVVPVDFLS